MCCEGPEAMATWAPSLLAAGPPQAAPPLPWVVDSVGPLTEEGGQAVESGARPGLACLAQLLSGPARALWFPCCPWGWFDSLPLTFPWFLMWRFHADSPLGML